jgi:hypothetical protein
VSEKNEHILLDHLQQIVAGFSKFKDLYIKHFTFNDEILLREYYDSQLKTLTELPTAEEQVQLLMDKGIWPKKKEGELNLKTVRLKAAEITLPNLLIQSQKQPIENQIKELKKELFDLQLEKAEYMGITREDIANQNSHERVLCLSVFNDQDFTTAKFTNLEADFDNIGVEELIEIQHEVGKVRDLCSIDNCKKIASCYYVQSMVNCLPENSEYKLIGKPIHTFTVSQINLVQYCSVFRKIFNKYTIPDDIAHDPDKILEFPKQAEKMEEIRQKNAGDGQLGQGKSYMGASAEEMHDMGMRGVDIHTKLKKSGKKSLSKHDLL